MALRIFVVALVCCASLFAQQSSQPAAKPQPPAAAQQPQVPLTVATILDRQFNGMERGFVAAAEAMPDDKFEFAPPETAGEFKSVRTFGDQVRHVAAGNFVFAAMVLGEKPQHVTSLEDMTKGVPAKGKAETVARLKESFALAHKALQSLTSENLTEMLQFPFGQSKMSRLSAANIMLWHSMDHYGQMVIYLRMNGIVPPASRQN